MKKALIISSAGREVPIIESCLRSAGYPLIGSVSNGSKLRRKLHSGDPALLVINTPLPDEFGIELAVKAAETTNAGILLICREEIADAVAEKVTDHCIGVASRPLTPDGFLRALKKLESTRSLMLGSQKENVSLLAKIEEMRLINRAKSTLMEYLKFTEPQAHKYIEKQAMNNRLTRREVALKVLASYKK